MRWTQPHNLKRPLKGQDGKLDHPNRGREEGPVMKVTTIGIDLAKDVFGLHGVDGEGRVTFKRRLVRSRLLEFLSQLPRCLVGLEACSSAHYWAREIERLGHRVRLMSPRFVKPYRKGDKNDANDAEAICEAVTRASMRFVPIKSEAQHEVQALHRVGEQLLKSRTALVNQVAAPVRSRTCSVHFTWKLCTESSRMESICTETVWCSASLKGLCEKLLEWKYSSRYLSAAPFACASMSLSMCCSALGSLLTERELRMKLATS